MPPKISEVNHRQMNTMLKKTPTVALINDTSLFSTHFGCELVGQTLREQFKRVGLDLVLSLPKKFDLENHYTTLKSVDLVVINGEGTFHHDKYRHVLKLAEQFPTILINCVYEKNTPNPALSKLLYCAARESFSAAEISKENIKCEVVPDLLFNASFPKAYPKSKPTRKQGITDNVVKEYHGIWPLRIKVKGFPALNMSPGQYIAKITSYEKLAVGRFHAAVLCSIFNIPFSTWDSNTWKTRALMKDMGIDYLHFNSRKEALANIPDSLPQCVEDFVKSARQRIDTMFDHIKVIADEQCSRSELKQ